ncbi:fluoride efflux transporter CrcB [Lentibacillus salinarum]|uniref:Fluoride-specific ion channel FluC n=1 Tax=Lentibacillus salinarum TaxID=446820 RepID=A0ABW3ZS94_9BACI
MLMDVLLVMAGGFLGAMARYGLGEWVYTDDFPLNTLVINLAGCLFLSWFLTFIGLRGCVSRQMSLLIGTGLTGSFTTFSTFSLETLQLVQAGSVFDAVLYSLASTVGGLLLAYVGYSLALSQHKAGGAA